MNLDAFRLRLAQVIADGFRDELCEKAANTLGERLGATYVRGVTATVEGDEIVVRLKGNVANFVEHGLGPRGVGDEGPFDMRTAMFRHGKTHQAIPVGDGEFRMMSATGKPWMHPGFRKHGLIRLTLKDLPRIAVKAMRSF